MKRNFTEQEIVRREKLKKLIELGRNPQDEVFKPNVKFTLLKEKYDSFSKQDLEDNKTQEYSIAGRVMMERNQGKAMFIAIKDSDIMGQAYIRKDSVSESD